MNMKDLEAYRDRAGAEWKTWRNMSSDLGKDAEQEIFEDLLRSGEIRIVRTISTGQASGPYRQEEAEWVLVLQGSAELVNAAGEKVELEAGDALYLPAGYEHTVSRTSDPCVWLCIYWVPDLSDEEEIEVEVNELPLISPLTAPQAEAFREVILSLRIVIHLPYANSLKDKRRVKQRLVSALQKENVSVMEVARQDQHRELYLSITSVALGQEVARKLERRLVQKIHKELSDGAFLQACEVEVL